MALITPSNFLTYTDYLSGIYGLEKTLLGSNVGTPPVGTVMNLSTELLNMVTLIGDYETQIDLLTGTYNTKLSCGRESVSKAQVSPALGALQFHMRLRGVEVNGSIIDIPSYLTYYAGLSIFTTLCTPDFATIYNTYSGSSLPAVGVMSPQIGPLNGNANGMGSQTIGGTFAPGAAVNTAAYSSVNLLLGISTSITGGTVTASFTVAGTDNTGVTSTTWTGSFSGANPISAVSTTTSGAIPAQALSSITLASAAGIVAGSVLTIDTGALAESIIVQTVAGNVITAVFQYAHISGVSVTGINSISLTPSVGGRRCTLVSSITIVASGGTAGVVRVEGIQDRVPI